MEESVSIDETSLCTSTSYHILDESDLLYPTKHHREHIHQKSFIDFVEKTLFGSNSIKKLSLKSQVHPQIFTDHWISNVLQRGVVDLDLLLYTSLLSDRYYIRSPFSFLKSKTLVKLTLELETGCSDIYYVRASYLPVLKSLSLHGTWYRCEAFYPNVFPGCPILEELSLHYYAYGNRSAKKCPEPFSISHTTLKRLTVHHNRCRRTRRLAEFDTPSLVYLDYSGLAPLQSSTSTFLASLVEAKLDVQVDLTPIINWMCNVKTLSLSSSSVKVIDECLSNQLPIFLNLVKLSFESNTEKGWEVLSHLLNKSPKLEILVLKGVHHIRKEELLCDRNGVKVLEIFGFRGNYMELRQVKYFLRKMHLLQVMKVEINAYHDDNKKLMRDLCALCKRSSKCQIKFL